MLRKRIISSVWITSLVIAAIWFGDPGYTILMAIVGILAVLELYKMLAGIKIQPLTYFGIIFALLFILSGNKDLLLLISPNFNINLITPLLIISTMAIPLLWLLRHARREDVFTRWAWTVAGIFYVGWLLSHLVALRGFEDGRNWVFFVVITTFSSDTFAFFIGRALGQHHLAPRISPGKTWEGAIGGVGAAVIISLVFILPTPFSLHLSYGQAIPLAILVSIFGQLGDLFESFLKRTTGVKDSGTLIPGHGGILDRLDSIIFAGLVVYLYVLLVIT
ncbi:phosphatidate cytidylyltransferase [Chloroflexota bacterium]